MSELLLADEVYEVVGAAMEVYYQLGTGFLEAVYQEALEIELTRRKIPFEAQKRLPIYYKDLMFDSFFVLCFQSFPNVNVVKC